MNDSSQIKRLFEYLPEVIKFHKLKNEGLARILFVAVLVFQMAGNYIEYKLMKLVPLDDIEKIYSSVASGLTSTLQVSQPPEQILLLLIKMLGTTLLVSLVTGLLYLVYMHSYISELRGKDSGFKASFSGIFKHFWRLLGYMIVFSLLVAIGLMFFVIPGIIAFALFVLGFCYILDLKLTIPEAMTASSEITNGKKVQIIGLFLGFFIMFKLPIYLILSGSSLGASYMASFFSTIVGLMLQRLICQVYMDLEYKK